MLFYKVTCWGRTLSPKDRALVFGRVIDEKSYGELDDITYEFLNILVRKSFNVTETIERFLDYMDWDNGEGLAFLKYLLSHKKYL